jgi:hypothetical protein
VSNEELSAVRYAARRIVRHARWARSEGLGRLIAEDRLDPVDRARVAYAKHRWRRRHSVAPGAARLVYVVGLQRSGTNMLLRGFDAAPEVEVRNENDRRLFHRFQLREDAVLVAAASASRHAVLLVKPLCQSHRVDELLGLPTGVPSRAVWAWRDVDERARSEVAKFGDANLRALRAVSDGTIGDRWQGQRLDDETRVLLDGFDYERMDPYTAAALFWYVRNDLYFRIGLHRRHDVLLTSYARMVLDPVVTTRRICAFIGVTDRPELRAHVVPGPPRSEQLPIDPRVRRLCADLTGRLTDAEAAQHG